MIETQDTLGGDNTPNNQLVDQTTEAAAQSSVPTASEDLSSEAVEAEAPKEKPADKKAPIAVDPRHRHFKHLSPRAHQWIEKNCGKWVLEAMRSYLFDPDRVFPDWGTRFAVTLKDIGKDQVIRMGEAEVLYDYVMTTPFWEMNYQIRKKLLANKPGRKHSSARRSTGKRAASKRSGSKPAEHAETAEQKATDTPVTADTSTPSPEVATAKPSDTAE